MMVLFIVLGIVCVVCAFACAALIFACTREDRRIARLIEESDNADMYDNSEYEYGHAVSNESSDE